VPQKPEPILPEPNIERTRVILAERFGDLALVLLLIAVITMLGGLIPFNLQNPLWLSDTIVTLIAIGPPALAALILLHLGSYYSPGSPTLSFRRTLCCRLAIFAVFGYLLLIPVQLGLSLQLYQTAQLRQQETAASMAQLEDIRRQVQAATSVRQIQDAIPLRGPLSSAGMNWTQPLDDVRQEIRIRISMAQVEGNRPAEHLRAASSSTGPRRGRRRGHGRLTDLNEANSAEVRRWSHSQRALIRISELLLWAAAFALMAQRPSSELPLLVEWTEGLNRPRRPRE